MISLINRKIVIQFILLGIVIMMYDVMLDSFFTIVHIAFEWFELALEVFIEHIFHTNRQQSQIIVFYLLWSIALFGFYLLWRALPGFYSRCKEQLLAASSQAKSQMINYWNEQPSSQKIKLASTLTASLSFLVFYAFS